MGGVIAGGLLTLLGVLLGVFLNVIRDHKAWRRENGVAAAATMVELVDVIWADDYTYRQFDTHVWKARVHLDLLGVSKPTLDELDVAARACRKSTQESFERTRGTDHEEFYGIGSEALRRLETAIAAANDELRPDWWKLR